MLALQRSKVSKYKECTVLLLPSGLQRVSMFEVDGKERGLDGEKWKEKTNHET